MRVATAPAARRGHNRGGEPGEYFASMTDLMLGLIFIFVIMMMAFTLNERQAERPAPAAPPQRLQPEVPPAQPPRAKLPEADLARRDLLRDLAKTLQSVLPVTVDEEDGTLQLGGDILFPKGSAEPYPQALAKLRLLGYALDRVLPCYTAPVADRPPEGCSGRHRGRLDAVYIEGDTDTTPIRTPHFPNNWELSAARASETFKALVDAYPGLAALHNDRGESLIGVSGYGDSRPLATNATPEGRQRNRRIALRFIMVPPKVPDSGRVP
jgi:flagellar motor protein MotB